MPSAEQQTAQLAAGVTELWRGGETKLEAWGPAPARGHFAALQTAMSGYDVDTMNVSRDNKWSAAAQAACLTCALQLGRIYCF